MRLSLLLNKKNIHYSYTYYDFGELAEEGYEENIIWPDMPVKGYVNHIYDKNEDYTDIGNGKWDDKNRCTIIVLPNFERHN